MATNLTPVGNEIQINLAPNQNDDQFDPAVATMTDGRFFVAFTDHFAAGNDNIVGQFINADGTLSGSNIEVENDAGFQFDPAVAQRSGGAAVVVWDDDAISEEIHYSIVSSAGVPGLEQTILDGGPLDDPDVATLADGRSLVVASQFTGGDNNIVFRFIDAGGAPGPAQDFIDNGIADQFDPAVAAFSNNALVVYEEGVTADTNQVQARFYNGTNFAAEVTIASISDLTDPGFTTLPDVAALTDGRFVVVWKNEQTDLIEGRLVSATGVPLGTAFTISEGYGEGPEVAALPGGGFIVAWEDYSSTIPPEIDGNDAGIHARRFDANGSPVGDEVLVNTGDPDSDQDQPGVATNTTTGQIFITWEDSHTFTGAEGDADPDGVRGHAFVTSTDIVNLTEGDDIVQTYNIAETINALGGDDLINALGGNDVVRGGAGLDRILGGLGNDQLFGEAGEDLLKGEDGDDLLVGGLGRDVQIGGTGRDTFDFNAVAESRGINRDVILGFSRAEDDRIDLRTIDAETGGGNQAFHLIGNAAFTGDKGELRFAGGVVQGDTNGDGVANFEIKVTGLGGGAVVGDFFL